MIWLVIVIAYVCEGKLIKACFEAHKDYKSIREGGQRTFRGIRTVENLQSNANGAARNPHLQCCFNAHSHEAVKNCPIAIDTREKLKRDSWNDEFRMCEFALVLPSTEQPEQ